MLRIREPVIRLVYGHWVQKNERYTDCSLYSNSFSNEMGNSLLDVREINRKFIVVKKDGEPQFPADDTQLQQPATLAAHIFLCK